MGEGSVQIRGLGSQSDTIILLYLFTHAHEAEAVGDHKQDHTYVLGKREKQMMEILRVDGSVPGIQVGGLQEATDDQGHVRPEFLLHFLYRDRLLQYRAV